MKKKYIAAILLIVGIVGWWYIKEEKERKTLEPIVGNGIYTEEERKFEASYSSVDISSNLGDVYSSINLSSDINVIIKPTDIPSFKIIADSNLMNYILTDIRGNTLHIFSKRLLQSNNKTIIEISGTPLEKISFDGKGDMKSEGALTGKDIKVNYSGNGNLDLEFEAENIKVVSNIKSTQCANHIIKGKCVNFVAFLEGSGTIDAVNLKTKQAKVAIYADGSRSKVIVNPEELLEIDSKNVIEVDETKGICIIPMKVKLL